MLLLYMDGFIFMFFVYICLVKNNKKKIGEMQSHLESPQGGSGAGITIEFLFF